MLLYTNDNMVDERNLYIAFHLMAIINKQIKLFKVKIFHKHRLHNINIMNVKTQCHIPIDDDMFRTRRPSSGLKTN
jgi:hypothetical protein